jgi:diguanylate cyclase (GGDEF)-like protein/PAS domain S-box-containing protein
MDTQQQFNVQMKEELLNLAYKNLLSSSIAITINSIILVYLLWDVVQQKHLMLWLVMILFVTFFRFMAAYYYNRNKNHYSIVKWDRIFLLGIVGSSLLWAGVSIFLFPTTIEYQTLVIILLVGMGAGATSSLASNLKAIRIFLLMLLIPLIFRLFFEGSYIHHTIGVLTIIFLLLMLGVSQQFYLNLYNTAKTKLLFEQAKDRLKVTQGSFQTIFNQAPTGIFYYDKELKINQLNREFAKILKVPDKAMLLGLEIRKIPDSRVLPAIESVLNGVDGYYEGEYITKIQKISIWITLRTSPIYDANHNIIGGVGIVSDITSQVEAQKKIEYQAFYDTLTDLPNRSQLDDRLKQAVIHYRKYGMISAILFLDLDHFKKTNDSLGHNIGDELLKSSGKRLQSIIRDEDLIARLGGDEFVILLGNLGQKVSPAITFSEEMADKIHTMMQKPFYLQGHTLNVSTSIGIAILNNSKDTPSNLLKYADTAMYQSKKDGRGCTNFYRDEMNIELKRRLDIENILRNAIENNELKVYYQPIIAFDTRQLVGAEALMRLHSKKLGDIYPDEFIPIAEETGLILSIGEWVLNRAIEDFMQWRKMLPDSSLERIAINISTKQFANDNFIDIVKRVINQKNIDPQMVELELTESIIIKDIKESISKMNQLRDMGIGVSIDDFGTGYSSLSYLKMLPFSSLKIDKSFTQDIRNINEEHKLINTIISIAKGFNMDIVVEGVENDTQYNYLLNRHCDFFQGYYCSHAISADKFEEFIKKKYNTN